MFDVDAGTLWEVQVVEEYYLLVNVGAAVVTVEMTTVTSAGKDRRVVTANTQPGGGSLLIPAVCSNTKQLIQLGQN